jgi:replication-associated recombination protein RarA
MSINIGLSKLTDAVRILASEDKPLQERIDKAISDIKQINSEKDIPPDLRSEFNELIQKINIYRGTGYPHDLQSNLAETIVDVFGKIIAYTWEYKNIIKK